MFARPGYSVEVIIMAEYSVQFRNKINGYDKDDVKQFVKDAEAKLQERAAELSNLQQQVADLEARLQKIVGEDPSLEEKIELYDKLMKKMDGDYTNLLAPAIAKAKAIEAKAQSEYEIRIDQARYAADGVYKEAADRIAGVVDDNMDRLYGLLDQFIYSKSLAGRISAFVKNCKIVASKVSTGAKTAAKVPGKAVKKAKVTCANVKTKVQDKVNTYKDALFTSESAE